MLRSILPWLVSVTAICLPHGAAPAAVPEDTPCLACVSEVSGEAPPGQLFSDFDQPPKDVSRLGTTWFCYNDAQGRTDISARSDYSNILGGALVDTADPASKPQLRIDGNGRVANGAAIDFTVGKQYFAISSFKPSEPHVGIGARLQDDLGGTYDLSRDSVTGFYFEYRLSGTGVGTVRLEARAYQPSWPGEIESSRLWWGRSLPSTGGAWKAARVMLSDLRLPAEGEALLDSAQRPLNIREMTDLQWSVYGQPGGAGTLALDNVRFLGARRLTPLHASIPARRGFGEAPRIQARLSGSFLVANLPGGTQADFLELVSPGGRTVHRAASPAGARLDVTGLVPGRYVLTAGRFGQPAGVRPMSLPVFLGR